MKEFKNPTQGNNKKSVRDILLAWQNDVALDIIEKQKSLASRRMFLAQSMGLIGAVTLPAPVLAKAQNNSAVENKKLKQPWLTLSAVQEHLFPRTGKIKNTQTSNDFSPGAKDINAIGYLYTMLHTPNADRDERKFILKGVSWLDDIANTMSNKPFIKLNGNDRERVLKKISASETGETWLSTLLRYVFEALLTDPVYGGNTNSMGWQWLEHQPGFPRPSENKKYWKLSSLNTIKSGDTK